LLRRPAIYRHKRRKAVSIMKLPHRRQFLHLAAGAASLAAVSRIAIAQTYPTRSVIFIVPFPRGGLSDIIARLMGQWLSERLGQPFIIENRPGANTNIAIEAVAKSAPDGYTLAVVGSSVAIGISLYEKVGNDLFRNITPVASIARGPFVMLVNPSFPAKTLPEFIAYAKEHPGQVDMASNGTGTTSHVVGELFKMMAQIDIVHVPYGSAAPVLTNLLGGQVQVTFDSMASSIENVRTGKLRALAVTTATRSEVMPDVPTVADFVPGYEASTWTGIGAPRNTPVEIIDGLNREINAALTDPKIRMRLTELGGEQMSMKPTEFGKFFVEDAEKWGRVIRAANIKAE
jgi:tripartite-type tricarboxylate transporter receptor subunit TctC